MFNTLPPCRDQDHIYVDILILGHLYHHSWSQPSWSTPPSRQCSPVASLAIGRYHLLHIDQHDHFDHDHHGHLHHNHLLVDHHHWSPESKVIPILTNSTSFGFGHHDRFDHLTDHHYGHLEPHHHSSLDASLARGQTTAAAWMWYTEAVNMNTLSSLSWTNLNTLKYFTLYGTKMELRNLHLLREQSTGELRTILYHWKAFSIIFLI